MSRASNEKNRMSVVRIKNDINRILYHSSPAEYPDKQLLRIVIDKRKAHHFEFLRAFTKWGAVGSWMDFPDEQNTVIEVQYNEDSDETNGKRLKELLNLFNKGVVHEDAIFMHTIPVEVSSL